MLDLNKPCRTRDGRSVRLLERQDRGMYPLRWRTSDGEYITTAPSGLYWGDRPIETHSNDIVNVTEQPKMRKLDWTKPLVDTNGLPVRVLGQYTNCDGKPLKVIVRRFKGEFNQPGEFMEAVHLDGTCTVTNTVVVTEKPPEKVTVDIFHTHTVDGTSRFTTRPRGSHPPVDWVKVGSVEVEVPHASV